ncbi:phage protein GemA/Gp16 family protein [Campylobacter pinnipediorum]|uniref:phage protein GemA/Gp16 family protein n=1 Tax=Campylobacter pinnipediorum TaxID=1965231 RepID=UPI00084D499A|nr:phage protein GemA/Gp16 family protein [Campylobacter pinnipediorum]AQW80776.1 putative DUF1018 domain protein [Campylobacter pinnipediorum subsp. pinnipediorum]AQW83338.1 putative DUF1018 domain protein [Campylobacter pinnipediorum subsp. pinnipediorum]OPA75419.1 hypothetical protein BFG05_05975 [Campylobacter pinnipediorum subsp. pinnipediorum]
MTKAQEIYRKQLLAKIHTHNSYKLIKNNDAWSDWLKVRFDVSSSKDLSIDELNRVLDIFNLNCNDEINLKPDYKGRNLNKSSKISVSQINKIIALQNELCWDDTQLLRFCARTAKVYFLYVRFLYKLDKKDATKIITGMGKILKKC